LLTAIARCQEGKSSLSRIEVHASMTRDMLLSSKQSSQSVALAFSQGTASNAATTAPRTTKCARMQNSNVNWIACN
jgi:hypothetical protein